jgi:thiosulfate dehydrogenase
MRNPAFLALVLLTSASTTYADEAGSKPLASPDPASKEVRLCDNKTTVKVPNGTPKTVAEGQKIADALMAQWKAKNPNKDWVAGEVAAHQVVPPEENSKVVGTGQSSTYGSVTRQDSQVWDNETYKFAVYGSKVFHSGDELGSEIAVSCDMCHPRAANTHPETYPKFQPQLGRVALLRDMINWCIEHPVRGKVLAPDDPKMRALEAYILAQRKGVALDYGKR